MKNILPVLGLFLIFMACNQSQEKKSDDALKVLTVEQKIAKANGIDNWSAVEEIQFRFNVERGERQYGRTWHWNPNTDDVSLITEKDTISYNRREMDSISIKTDRAFINDKFWLLAPYNLVWDEGTNIRVEDSVIAPISKKQMHKLTVVYGEVGGYTPGDAYDYFYDDDFMITEWVFRVGNQEAPSLISTWEDYEEINGIKISKMRQNSDGTFKLFFTELKVKTNN